MIEKGYKVVLIKGSYTHLSEDITPSNEKYNIYSDDVEGRLKIVSVKTPKYDANSFIGRVWNFFIFFWRVLFFKVNTLPKPSIVIVSSMPLFCVLNGVYLKWKYKFPFILEVRDIWPLTPIMIGGISKYNPFMLLLTYLEKLGYKKADLIVSTLPLLGNHIKNILPRLKYKFAYITNGFLLEKTNKNSSDDFKDTALLEKIKDKFVIGYTGTLGEANGMQYLIEAAVLLKNRVDIHFVLVGEGYKKDNLIALSNKNNLTNISFINKVPKKYIKWYLNQFDVCYIGWNDIPLYQFGISANKIYDYMCSAKPILMSGNIGADPIQLAKSGKTVPPSNPDAIASAIHEFYAMNKKDLRILGDNGRKYFLENYTYNILADKYVSVFKSLDVEPILTEEINN